MRLTTGMPPRAGHALLCARGLSKSFARGLARSARRTVAVDAIDIDLREGDVLALAGGEGAGKTTLLQCLCGLLRHDDGVLEIKGAAVNGEESRQGIAHVPAVPVFYPFLTVRDVLEFRLARDGAAASRAGCVDRVLAALGLRHESRCRIAVLPPDLLKRVAVAEALVMRPRILLVDMGPSESLGATATVMLEALRDWASGGAAVVIASRNASDVAAAASRFLFMDQGRIVSSFALDSQPVPRVAVAETHSPSLFVAERSH